jgi:hypothetical protein
MIKACPDCRRFYDASHFHPDTRMKDGLVSSCRKCRNRKATNWQRRNPRSKRNTHLKAKFGITIEQFDSMLANQNYQCAICMSSDPKGRGSFHVDHCHKTGTIRGLLCHDCNTGIGKLGDTSQALQKAVDYLERFADG